MSAEILHCHQQCCPLLSCYVSVLTCFFTCSAGISALHYASQFVLVQVLFQPLLLAPEDHCDVFIEL